MTEIELTDDDSARVITDEDVALLGGRDSLTYDRIRAFANREKKRESRRHRVSVWAVTPLEGEEILDTVARIVRGSTLPHGTLHPTTVGDLRNAGFDVVATPPEPYHLDVEMGGEPTDETCDRFISAFGEALDNPVPKRDRVQ